MTYIIKNRSKYRAMERLVENELNRRGISNVTHVGGLPNGNLRVEHIETEAQKKAKKIIEGLPERVQAQANPKTEAVANVINQAVGRFAKMGVKGVIKSGIGKNNEEALGPLKAAGQIAPLRTRTAKIQDPDNLTITPSVMEKA